jgi:hypothetical protein
MADLDVAHVEGSLSAGPALAISVIAASYLGCALLALCQKPQRMLVCAHAAQLSPALTRRCGIAGGASLGLALALSLLAEGPSFGSIYWVLSLALAGIGVTFTLAYRPQWLVPLQRAFAPAQPRARAGAFQLPTFPAGSHHRRGSVRDRGGNDRGAGHPKKG